jgi:poly(3-hydroxybutyrate) depolymerase
MRVISISPWPLAAASAAVLLAACAPAPTSPPAATVQLAPARPGVLQGTCADVSARLTALPHTRITAVSTVAAGAEQLGGQPLAEHCLVTGRMAERTGPIDGKPYAIGFELRLPVQWNGRFYHQGNGGIDGVVQKALGALGGGPLTGALAQGFAVLSSDAGHAPPAPHFGLDPQARLDYGYQAVGKLTPMARQVIAAAYGRGPDRSYFGGCSNGGRHAMVAAARYAADYDGILAGAPGYNLPKAALANIAGAQWYKTVATSNAVANPGDLSTAFTDAERATVAQAVLAKCDALDGARDGLIEDVAACRTAFDLQRDVPTCTSARNGQCLSAAQKTAIGHIFNGPRTRSGERIYASFPYDSGVGGASFKFWEFTASLNLDSGAVGLIFGVPPQNPAGFNGTAFTLNSDLDTLLASVQASNATYTESAMAFMTPPQPTRLDTLRDRGGKMMVYHGVSDAIFSVDDTETWYQGLQKANGGHADRFARFYRVPGMGHCSGGAAADQFDMLGPLVNWVEKGIAPNTVRASARGQNNPGTANPEVPTSWAANRSRPLCSYPQVARYSGSGSLDDAANFACR